MKAEELEKIHKDCEIRTITPDFKVVKEKRMVEDTETELSMIEGVGAVLETWTDMGGYREMVRSTAFNGCDMSDVVSCFNHDPSQILSRTTGLPDDLTVSVVNNQVVYRFAIKNDCAEDVAENISLKFIKGSSFMFRTKSDSWSVGEDGVGQRVIEEVETLFELGPVTFPAYNTTSVAARSKAAAMPEIRSEKKDKYFYKKQLRTK